MTFVNDRERDMVIFGRELVASRDIDPTYLVLRRVLVNEGVPLDSWTALWYCYLFVTYCDTASATQAWFRVPQPSWRAVLDHADQLAILRCGPERRGLRGGLVVPHLLNLLSGGRPDLLGCFGDARNPVEAFWCAYNAMLSFNGNGRWAAYKWVDILRNTLGYPIEAPGLLLESADGPLGGILYVYESTAPEIQRRLFRLCVEECNTADWFEAETVLCNYKSLAHGRYYVGADIDEIHSEILNAVAHKHIDAAMESRLYRARADIIPHHYLGEFGNWLGTDKDRKKVYRDQGLILARVPEGDVVLGRREP